MAVGFCTSETFMAHQTGPRHPERPDRLRAVLAAVHEAKMIHSPSLVSDEYLTFGLAEGNFAPLTELPPRPATMEDLLRIHPARHIERVRIKSETGGTLDGGDTTVGPGSYEAAVLAAGAGLVCVDAVMSGQVQSAFAAVRPPGHHAEPNAAMGFCLFSNTAIAAAYARQVHGLSRVAIVDWDVHHGNGTQAAFYADPSVLFISLHENPHVLYPGTGFDWEIGGGPGRGFTLNIPLPEDSTDEIYVQAMEEKVLPKLDAFAPELLLISAGFDAHRDDPLADMHLTEAGYIRMTELLKALAQQHCAGRIVSILEGGYNLRALGRSVVYHLDALAK